MTCRLRRRKKRSLILPQAFVRHASFAVAAVPQYPLGTGLWRVEERRTRKGKGIEEEEEKEEEWEPVGEEIE